eukprot:m.128162 g.128162  ORF g.128162 m.128162 type:complete len:65 (-) comp9743_c5_seq1:217-411(-)
MRSAGSFHSFCWRLYHNGLPCWQLKFAILSLPVSLDHHHINLSTIVFHITGVFLHLVLEICFMY